MGGDGPGNGNGPVDLDKERAKRTPQKERGPNGKFPNGKKPIDERIMNSLGHEDELLITHLFWMINGFVEQKIEQREELAKMHEAIQKTYEGLPPGGRDHFFSMLYNQFAETYDKHMEETGHYKAIRRVMGFAQPYLIPPMLDITAGTGEPLKYAMELGGSGRYSANEISIEMLKIAQQKLSRVLFSNQSAYGLSPTIGTRFNTVLCSQTFHLISDDDKPQLVKTIGNCLAPGGMAVVIEEDPFRITPSEHIEAVSLFIRAIARPIEIGTLIVHFVTNGFTHLKEYAVSPIDSEHSMRLHLFQKNEW